jgi:hypothetical protein
MACLKPLRDSQISHKQRTFNASDEDLEEWNASLIKAVAKWTIVPGAGAAKTRNIHWSTFRKCLRNCGGEWTSNVKGGATHSWIDGM